MTEKPHDQLDALLHQWIESRTASDEQINALRARISSAVRDEQFLDVQPMPQKYRQWPITGRAAWFGLGAAAAVLVACLLWPGDLSRQRAGSPERQPSASGEHSEEGEIPRFTLLRDSQLAEKAALLDEMERVFDDRLSWVAESDGKVCVGLSPRPGQVSRDATPIAVRVVVVSRRGPEQDWSPVWTVDVVTRGEELVALTPDSSGSGEFLLWTHLLPDGMIAVDASFALEGPIPLRSSFSGMQQGGVPKAVLSIEAEDTQYRIFQTVRRMRSELG